MFNLKQNSEFSLNYSNLQIKINRILFNWKSCNRRPTTGQMDFNLLCLVSDETTLNSLESYTSLSSEGSFERKLRSGVSGIPWFSTWFLDVKYSTNTHGFMNWILISLIETDVPSFQKMQPKAPRLYWTYIYCVYT